MVRFLFKVIFLLILGACASKMKDQLQEYRNVFRSGDFTQAKKLLEKSDLKKDQKSLLLWHLESGTVAAELGQLDEAIAHFQQSLELIDQLFTTKLTSKAASLLINDAADDFYGASYERSYAHYYLSKVYYQRYLISQNKLDLQSSRAAILAWDTYFTELQRSGSAKTIYDTDLMLKVFGGQIHELSDIRSDLQISLQLYKDALQILDRLGGVFSLFNEKSSDYIKAYEEALKTGKKPDEKNYIRTPAFEDLRDFLHYKVLALTKEIRPADLSIQLKALNPTLLVKKRFEQGKGNVVVVLEEGLIPAKVGKPFNFGLKGAMNAVDSPSAKSFIASVGVTAVTLFAMNKLGMVPTRSASPGSFMFAHDVTRLAVQEAAVEFELPMIENVPPLQRLELFIMDEKGVVLEKMPMPVVSENGQIARVVLEEDVVSRYVKTGTRVAVRHIAAIVAAMGVYQSLNRSNDGDFLAKSAAMGTYVAATKGIAALEKADTRHWTTLPQAFRMMELKLNPGLYKLGVATYSGTSAPSAPMKLLGDIKVEKSGKTLHTFRLQRAE
jgi:hypothetical protein